MTETVRLAQVYPKLGRVDDAQKIENELSKTLVYADPEHPILRQLRTIEDKPKR
jgi:hypothetical protein